jgi:histidinol-phosphate aminotransferase
LDFDTDIAALIRPEIMELENHLPQGQSTVRIPAQFNDKLPEGLLKLDANENPYGCSVRVQELLASFDLYHLYPASLQDTLRERLEEYTGIKRERIWLANGVGELTDLLMRVFVGQGDEVIICPPTGQFYRLYAGLAGANVVEVARQPETFELQLDQIQQTVTERTKLIIVGSPNNPTGNVAAPAQLAKLLENRAIVVVDESFYEFAGTSAAGLVGEFDNLVVLRSFSHWAGLAGLRIGYGLFSAEVVKPLEKVRAISGLNAGQILAAQAALDDLQYYNSAKNWLKNERGRLFRQLRKLNFLQPYPSQANFLLCKVVRGDAFWLKQRLERDGVYVKYLDDAELPNHLRITVGRPEDTDRLMQALLAVAEEI